MLQFDALERATFIEVEIKFQKKKKLLNCFNFLLSGFPEAKHLSKKGV